MSAIVWVYCCTFVWEKRHHFLTRFARFVFVSLKSEKWCQQYHSKQLQRLVSDPMFVNLQSQWIQKYKSWISIVRSWYCILIHEISFLEGHKQIWLIHNIINEATISPTGLEKSLQFSPKDTDIIITSFPKSGTTWTGYIEIFLHDNRKLISICVFCCFRTTLNLKKYITYNKTSTIARC